MIGRSLVAAACALAAGMAPLACGDDIRLGGVASLNASDDAASDAPFAADADGTSDAACSANLASDPANCGACGHDCLGGTCSNGACQPAVLAENLGGPFWIALDATTVYWTERGNAFPTPNAVRRVDKDRTNPVTLATSTSVYGAIVLDATNVYWSAERLGAPTGIALETTPRGAAPDVLTVTHIDGSFVASGVALDATNVYFGTGAEVLGAPKTSLDGPLTDVMGGLSSVGALATDGTTLFAADTSGVLTTAATLPMVAGAGTLLPGTSSGASDVALVGGRLYGARGANVWSVPSSGGAPTYYSTTETGATGVTADATSVYWTTTIDVRAAPVGGGGPVRVLATGYSQLGHVAVDAAAIYYADFAGNQIWKLAK